MAKSEQKFIDSTLFQKCNKCNEWKPADIDHYSKSTRSKSGFKTYCRVCLRLISRTYHTKKYEGLRVRKKCGKFLPLNAPPLKKTPFPDEFKSFYKRITSNLEGQARFKAYLITCKTTNQYYVGITERKLESRWMQHLRDACNKRGYLLHQIISQYGIWDFDFKYVASAKSRSDLHELEKQLIRQYDSVENGLNQTRGGASGESVGNSVTVDGIKFISLNAAARHYGVEEYAVHQRISRYGFTLEEALEIEIRQKQPPNKNPYQVEEKNYPNFAEACRQYKLDDSVVRSRLGIGWSVRQAFGIDPSPKRGRNAYGKSVTINGKVYRTFSDAAREYNLPEYTLTYRVRNGWTPEQAVGLDPPPPPGGEKNGTEITVDGVTYSSRAKAVKVYGLNPITVHCRLKLGWTIEQALGLASPPTPSGEKTGKAITVMGVTYSSIIKAANAFNLKPALVRERMNKFGWTIEQAFNIAPPPRKPNNFAKKTVILGVTYESMKSACAAYKISLSAVERRVKNGWTLEEAITTPSRKLKLDYL